MAKNALHHDKTLSSHRTEATYSRSEKRWAGGGKSARIASRRYNKAVRKASKLQLSRYQTPSTDVPEPFWAEEPECDGNHWADELAEEIREEWWDDCEEVSA
jgi:hypothetical protein